MPLVPFQTLLNRSLRLCGLDPLNVPQTLADSFADWLQERVGRAWIASLWPDTLALEQRAFADTWLSRGYGQGDAVYYAPGNAYYKANANTSSADVPGTSAKWVSYVPNRWVPFDTSNYLTPGTLIAEPLEAWKHDPRMVRGPGQVGFWHDGKTVFLDPKCGLATVWLRFRTVAPQLSATPLDITAENPTGTLWLWRAPDDNDPTATGDGHCYLVLGVTASGQNPRDNANLFARQAIPHVLADYAARGAKADWLSDDGQDDKAAQQEILAQGWLQDRLADLVILQGQTANYSGRR